MHHQGMSKGEIVGEIQALIEILEEEGSPAAEAWIRTMRKAKNEIGKLGWVKFKFFSAKLDDFFKG